MDYGDLDHDQAKAIAESLAPGLNFLHRLRERMIKVGFTPSDPYFALVSKAYAAMHELNIKTRYLAASGAGNPFGDEATEK